MNLNNKFYGNKKPSFVFLRMCLDVVLIMSPIFVIPVTSLFTSTKEVMFLPAFVCGFVSLFVNKITQKLMDGFS